MTRTTGPWPEPSAWGTAPRARRPGEQALRTALRRFRRPARPPSPTAPTGPDAAADARRAGPHLTPAQVQALLGAGVTLVLLLWDHLRQRLEGR
jgi:hypothetical protein